MTNPINVSYSTVLVATDARLSIIALSDQIKTTGDTPEALADLLNHLASLEPVVHRLSLASGCSPATARNDIEAHVHSLLLDCEETCDEFEKTFRAFIDRSLGGTTRKLNRDRFGISGELEVQLLSKRLSRWKDFLSSIIDPFLLLPLYPSENVSQERQAELLARENSIANVIGKFDEDGTVLQDKLVALNRIVRQTKKQATEIRHSRELLDKLRSEVHLVRTGQRVEISDGGRFRLGVTDSRRGNHPTQSIHNVRVCNNSQSAIGVFDDLDVNEFFRV
ncbi:hypothetical protein N7499_004125 [Penicillium canescens]|uniref:Azaphilone pigments biosynthesis cluster protein L N-terminal domain-containing protein n=1 Tax=Penicillium canescens TaxID=5083 RepID=A0AAD6N754_PENCN|nr:uncharacterized protein N7446_012174 [Penicillium canescens]KAJ6019964.1 hypothetical protein N7522_000039 [Penicillium canescens]KAJ6037893.1 hypothetical protein N7460_007664 [Penicillium canescens]KAJ6045310.1 hypothetical protein N7446_012174 [Penicillium canescens]KAJ6061011.1 hypothetical protein N7444_001707 [Penicillium canescens]KAJ6088874.1 hypothetical protein N7499_004125 [Penicillium canescens]